MKKSKQLDLETAIEKKLQSEKITRPVLWSSCCPYRENIGTENLEPSMTRQEFADECDINQIMRTYEATGILPNVTREPLYWDADQVPANLQDAMSSMLYAKELFMQLGAPIRKEFDNDAVKFVEFASNADNRQKLKEWGLTAPEPLPDAPVRVEVVTPPPAPPTNAPAPPPQADKG